ncbi:NUDIX domain-containing protein [Candidatus Woesebacteria bacterium]|nr:NUDIX domain-containing protein [Candidatus Woesebacteria bacterium]
MTNSLQSGIDYIGVTTPFYCHDGKGHLLLAQRSSGARDEHGAWDPGSGQLEFGSSIEENILKEVKEEYGCEAIIQKILPAHSILRTLDGKQTHWLAVPAFVLVDRAQVRLMEPTKFSQFGWFALEQLPPPLHQGFTFSFEKYKAQFFAMLSVSDES